MSNANPDLEEALFEMALQIADERERATFLDQACLNKPDLRLRLETLLHAQDRGTGLLPHKDQVGCPTPTLFEEPTHPGEHKIIGRYKLLQRIGEGGFGEVWMAEQKEPVKRRVALKIIKLGMDTKEVIGRFEAERQALALMDHPNIARVFDAGSTDTGRPYFIMELVRGVKITEYCDIQKLSTRARLELFIKVCHAVQHAHQKGIIHRDLKPSNILITLHDGVPVPKVIDFGISKAMQGELTDHTVFTRFEQFIGTPAYISPEQAEMSGLDVDTRSDIYSLGVLLYELLVGRTPFDAAEMTRGGLEALRLIIREKDPVRPSTKLRTLSQEDLTSTAQRRRSVGNQLEHSLRGDLDWIVMKCLEKDRVRRYETTNALALDINRYLTNEPVLARPPSTLYKIRKTWQRNKLLFTAGIVVVFALTIGFGVSAWQAIRATQAREAEGKQREIAEEKQHEAEEQQRLALAAIADANKQRQRADEQRAYAEKLLYSANMNLAQAKFESDNYLVVQRLLKETADYPDKGFEWYYWLRQMHREIRSFPADIHAIAFSPDSKRVAGVEYSGNLLVWDRETGKVLTGGKVPNRGYRVAFSPDGQRILSGSSMHNEQAQLTISDALTGAPLEAHLQGFTKGSFSRDGRFIVAYNSKKIAIVDAVSGDILLPISEHRIPLTVVDEAVFSPDGNQVVAVNSVKDVTLESDWIAQILRWDAHTGQPIGKIIELPKVPDGWWEDFSFSPDIERILAGGYFGGNILMDLTTGKPLKEIYLNGKRPQTFVGHSDLIDSFAFSPDARYVMTGSKDKTVRIWDTETFKEVGQLHGHTDKINAVAWSPDGRWMATSAGGTVRIWAAESTSDSDNKTTIPLVGKMSPDGRQILTAGTSMTLLDADTERPIQTFEMTSAGMTRPPDVTNISPDGKLVLTLWNRREHKLLVWGTSSGRSLVSLNFAASMHYVLDAIFSPDSQLIVTCTYARGGMNGMAQIWKAETGELIRELDHHTASVTTAAFSPDRRHIITAAFNSNNMGDGNPTDAGIRIWETASGKEVQHLEASVFQDSSLSVSPDGKHFAVSVGEAEVKIFDFETGRERVTLTGHYQIVYLTLYSPDGTRILTLSKDQTVKLWDAENGRELLSLKVDSKFTKAGFLSQGRSIIISSEEDGTRIFQTANPEQAVFPSTTVNL